MYIKFVFPYSFEKNLGQAYNKEFEGLNDNDWVCLTDADIMLLGDYGNKMKTHIEKNPDTGLFTCYTNRVKKTKQLYGGEICENDSLKYHATLSNQIHFFNLGKSKEITAPISGFLMLIKVEVWRKTGGFCNKGILNVDNDFSRKVEKVGYKIRLMQDIYAIHYYRMLQGIKNKKHLL